MSKVAERFKKHFNLGLWSEETLVKAVEKGVITQDEFEEIIGG